MDYVTQQRKWAEEVGLEIGDKVLIVSDAVAEQGGWGDSWVPEMDGVVGRIGVVTSPGTDAREDEGIVVSVDGYTFNYPFFVLVKVEE